MDELKVEREDVVEALGELHMQILGLQREVRRLRAELAQQDRADAAHTNGHAHIDQLAAS